MTQPRPPLIPPTPAERQRLAHEHFATLAELLNERTFQHILALGICDGWHCWEAGAGGASMPGWLTQQVGPTGHVLASDIDTSALEGASGRPFEVRRHDLTVDPPPAAEFDLVHARLVLEHLTDPSVALTTLIAALRPGGWLLVESADPKLQPLACPDESGPKQALANKLRIASWELMAQRTDLRFGRTLPRLFRDAGLIDVEAEVAFALGGPDARHMQHTLITRARPALIAPSLASEAEIEGHLADLGSLDLDVAVFPIVSARGRKQPDRPAPQTATSRRDGA
jgi:SAM-dependent methyltransferase